MDEENDKLMLIFTGPSGSWKTTFVERLKKEFWFTQPLQFTTRQPRDDEELDCYVFLTKEQFFTKLENGDFIEHTLYNGNYYALWKHLSSDYNIAILEPCWREQVKQFCALNDIRCVTVFLDIDEKTMLHRLGILRRESYKVIQKRLNDLKIMSPKGADIVIDSTAEVEVVYRNLLLHLTKCGVLER